MHRERRINWDRGTGQQPDPAFVHAMMPCSCPIARKNQLRTMPTPLLPMSATQACPPHPCFLDIMTRRSIPASGTESGRRLQSPGRAMPQLLARTEAALYGRITSATPEAMELADRKEKCRCSATVAYWRTTRLLWRLEAFSVLRTSPAMAVQRASSLASAGFAVVTATVLFRAYQHSSPEAELLTQPDVQLYRCRRVPNQLHMARYTGG